MKNLHDITPLNPYNCNPNFTNKNVGGTFSSSFTIPVDWKAIPSGAVIYLGDSDKIIGHVTSFTQDDRGWSFEGVID